MSIISQIKKILGSKGIGSNIREAEQSNLNAKELQLKFVKENLKPLLKQQGFLTKGQTWWRDQGEFFIIINLQNFSWNLRDDVSFCFNIGIGLKALIKDAKHSPGYNNLHVILREDAYLAQKKEHKYRNQTGYLIKTGADFVSVVVAIKRDFEEDILPQLNKLKTLKDCLDCYGDIPFWGDNLKKLITNNNLFI